MKNFQDLKLSPLLAMSIAEMGYTVPTPIQAQTLPILMNDPTDFMGMAATGTGKTAAFGIPLLEKVDPDLRATQCIVICPTRELAVQVAGQLASLGKHKMVRVQAVYGGKGYGEQARALQSGVPIVVATPGRLIDYLKQGVFSLDAVTTVVFDEADEMLTMGFKEELEYLLDKLPADRCRRWFFAATMSAALKKVADKYLRKQKNAHVNKLEPLSGTVRQVYYTVREKNKPKGLCKLIDMADNFYGLIFCQTKAQVVALTEYLRVRGYHVDCLHGDKTQAERERTLKLFRERNVTILVGSDVAARGLDVKELTHVINYSLPYELDSYVHRIGRTGRSGQQGIAMNLVAPTQMDMVERIEKLTKSKMEAGFFPTRKEISQKKLAAFLTTFQGVKEYPRALAVLDENWAAALEAMPAKEVAARFLALTFPALFDDSDRGDEVGLEDRMEERPSRTRARFVKPAEGRFADRPEEVGGRPRRPAGRFRERSEGGGERPRRPGPSRFGGPRTGEARPGGFRPPVPGSFRSRREDEGGGGYNTRKGRRQHLHKKRDAR